jgi:hypothetical protein
MEKKLGINKNGPPPNFLPLFFIKILRVYFYNNFFSSFDPAI